MMRWYKHVTNSHNDEKLAEILFEFGLEGYGFWWLLLEIVGKEMDGSERCELSYPLATWARKLHCSKRKTSMFFQKFSEIFLIFLDFSTENEKSCVGKLTVKIPNLLKYRDEYSKKSGQTPDKIPKDSGAKIQNTDTENNKGRSKKKEGAGKELTAFEKERADFFEQLWKAYPPDGRVKKKEALRHYLASAKVDADLDRINDALGEYIRHLEANEWKKPQNASTWFNNWQDWEPEGMTDAA